MKQKALVPCSVSQQHRQKKTQTDPVGERENQSGRTGQDSVQSRPIGASGQHRFCTCNAAPGREVRFGCLLVVGPNHRPKNRARSAQLGHRKIMQRRPVEQVAKQGAAPNSQVPSRIINRMIASTGAGLFLFLAAGNQLVRGRCSSRSVRLAVHSPIDSRKSEPNPRRHMRSRRLPRPHGVGRAPASAPAS